MDIVVGDKIRTIPHRRKENPKFGVVINVTQHNPANPIEEHGFVTVIFDDGEEEHYTHTGWSEFIRILEQKSEI